MSMNPRSQFDVPSDTIDQVIRTLMSMITVLRGRKFKSIGWSIIQPIMTANGTTASAICVDDPTAMPIEMDILS